MKEKFMKWSRPIGIVLAVVLAFILVYKGSNMLMDRIMEKNLEDIDWIRGNVSLDLDSTLGSNIYSVTREEHISIYNMKYQQVVGEYLDALLNDTDYTMEDPLIVFNPYGTNNLGANIYFDTEEEALVSYTISVEEDDISDFQRNLKNSSEDNYTTNHSYQLIGFVPGYLNHVRLEAKNRDGDVIATKEFTVDLSDTSVASEVILEKEDGESDAELSNGLYTILGNDSDEQDYVFMYDNDGIIRYEIPIIGYRAHAILFRDDKMYFSISQTRIVEINSLGEVSRIYRTGEYQLHHDYTFDEDGNLLVLANNTNKDTEEDCIIKIDLDSGDVSEVIDFEDMFQSYVDTCTLDTTSTRDEGEDGLDWLHLNSIEYVDGDVFLSSRETSSILKVADIETDPKLVYILSDPKIWEDTEFSEYVYEKQGDFKIHAGQHSVRYSEGEEDGVYYLTFFDNNYGRANSQPDFDFSEIGITNDNAFQGDESYYYVYRVNENDRTFELVDSFDVIYSGIVSSVQTMDNDNIIVDSGTAGTFAEYDSDHQMIQRFTTKMNKYMVYRILKYDFNGFWFYEA